ncbi:UPF0149 family protein [Ferrimonas aestuarii]|nr:UPF0149 family protein [Ferrimonas aestuarii]
MSLSPQKLRAHINALPLSCPNSLNFYYLHGFLSAVIAAPEPILPSHWLAILLGPNAEIDDESTPALSQLALQLSEQPIALPSQCRVPRDNPLAAFDGQSPLHQWAKGFELALPLLSDQFDPEDPGMQQTFAAFASYGSLFANLESIRQHFIDSGQSESELAMELPQVRRQLTTVLNECRGVFQQQHFAVSDEQEPLLEALTLFSQQLAPELISLIANKPKACQLATEELQLFLDAPQIDAETPGYLGHWHSLMLLAHHQQGPESKAQIEHLLALNWQQGSPVYELFGGNLGRLAGLLAQLYAQQPGHLMAWAKHSGLSELARAMTLLALYQLRQTKLLTAARWQEAVAPLLDAKQKSKPTQWQQWLHAMLKLSEPSSETAGWLSQADSLWGEPAPLPTLKLWHGAETAIRELHQECVNQGWQSPTAPEDVIEPAQQATHSVVKAGRNDPCPCGSGQKFKRCCGR